MVAKLNFWICSLVIHMRVVASPLSSKALVSAQVQQQLLLHLLRCSLPGPGPKQVGFSWF